MSRCHRRFQHWIDTGVFHILTVLADDVYHCGELDLSECCIDGTCVLAKKGVPVLFSYLVTSALPSIVTFP